MKNRRVGKLIALFLGVFVTVFCCTLFEGQSLPVFSETEEEKGEVSLLILSYGDISPTESSKTVVSLDTLKEDVAFLSDAGYVFVNSEDLIAYKQGRTTLPEKAVWLTFDDGFESVYTLVYPFFQEQGIKGDVFVVGSYSDLYSGNLSEKDGGYLSYTQLKELSDSGLFQIGNHTYALHEKKGIDGRKGVKQLRGEDDESYRKMLMEDVLTLQNRLNETIYKDSRVFSYPFGEYTTFSEEILRDDLGFLITLTYDKGINSLSEGSSLFGLCRYQRDGRKDTEDYFKKIV